jgi:hypothetical protein
VEREAKIREQSRDLIGDNAANAGQQKSTAFSEFKAKIVGRVLKRAAKRQ